REQAQNVPPLVAVSREQVLPASFAQQRLWFLEQLEMDTAAYHIPAALRMRGALDVPALKRSLGALAERHESLRTSFSASNGEVRQVIHPCTEISLPLVHLCSLVPDAREQELQRLVNSEVLRPFDLTCPPLWRALLFQLDEEEHVLLLTMHHSISDGPSCGIFVDEMLQYYSAFSQGTGCTLAPLSIQYADFSLWQRQLLCGEASGAQLDYWRRQLDGVTLLELPLDHPRPSVQTFRGADITFTLPRHLLETLQAVSRHEGVTLFMTLLAAFQVLLYRYTDQEDITIGTPVTHRNRTELERQIGFYVNTLVLRANLAHNPTFSELLAQIREICLEAYTNQDLPFEQIVEALQPPRDLSRSPFFQVMFMMQHAADIAGVKSVPHLQIDLFPIVNQTAKFDLTLEIIQSSEQTQGRLEYASDLFDAPSMARLVERWQILLEGIAANAEAHIAELPLLTADEYRLSIEEWNATQRPYPADLCLHQLIEAQVEHTPDHIAAVFADEQLSYHELNQRANQLARYLQSITAQPEARVGIYMEPSLLLPVSLLGVLKAGYSYVPIDLAYPDERVGFMMQDAQITILLTQTRHMEKLKGISERIQVVALDAVGSMLEAQGIEALRSSVCPDNLAYILYTSGSTGLPKGVMIPHRGLVNYLHWCSQRYAVVLGQGVPVHSPLSFDLTVTSLFSPLISGQTVLLLPSGQGVEALSSAFQTYTDMSLVKITPAHMALLSQQPEMRDHAANSRLFVIGGEQLLAEKLAFWQELAPETNFINEYGPTETVVGCCIYQVPPGEQTTGPVPIGRPIANTQLYLLSAYGQPVPVGLAGELYIGGAGLAHGYLNRPDLTAERFIPNPFDSRGGTRLYRTGDLARYRADGVLEFLGRNDHQVKVRSFRIELGEIEAVLARFPGLHECAVTVREDIPGVQRLVAYVGTRQADGAASGQQLKMYAQQHLPDYMVPALFVQLEQLPLTSNGKVDRKRLPVPGEIKREDDTEFIAPRTEVEK
ncbi:MAG TPA: amino acid adenylation domain-containing protein, partial [Ktedonobacteraceae bacterium]|nr:amino acid adenylation domain-containing protein [Ktedonobacteraceae bacterium]